MEILRLHYKDEKVFPYKKYVTKLKENFRVLEKDPNERVTGSQQVHTMLHGMNTIDVGVEAAKTTVFHSMRNSFDKAVEFMSAYISNRHAGAQADYANRHGGGGHGRRYVSATGSDDTRGGRGRNGGGRSDQRGGRGCGGRGRGSSRRTYVNNVDITDPHRNCTSAEWEKLRTMRNYVLQLREVGGPGGGRGNADNRSITSSMVNRMTSGVTATNKTTTAAANDHSVVSDITGRGSQNGRSFGRGAYTNNNN